MREVPGSIPGAALFLTSRCCSELRVNALIQFATDGDLHRLQSGVAQWLACWAHNSKVGGSKPLSANYYTLFELPY